MKKLMLLISTLVVILALSACNSGNRNEGNVVYTTVYPVQYLVEQLAGDTVRVERVPGSLAHSTSYSWSARELVEMVNADLLFHIAGGVDNYIPNNEAAFSDGGVELVDISQHVEYNMICLSHDHEDSEDSSDDICDENSLTPDPHFWLDPVKMLQAAQFIKDKLIATYPENEKIINNNYLVLSKLLDTLDRDYQRMGLEATKPIITTVMLFTYWHERYELEILPLTKSIHTSDQDPSDIIDIIVEATERNIHYILFERNANSPSGEQVLLELRDVFNDAEQLYLHGLGNLTSEEFENGSNYITIMYENLDILKLATK
ncbi:zinc ABC transporter substrate-binding protein [Candidatus Izimaplasma bacterium]|nr:zinc ABC transporter substrate-binding protein [Candidatus Izimaplasma bacterium]